MLWMPTRRLTGSSSISSAITKLAKSPAVRAAGFDLVARVGQQADDGDGAQHLDQRRGKRLLQDVSHVGLAAACRAASRNRRDSYASAPKAFTTMWPLRVSCRIWFSSACWSCVRRLVRRMRRPMRVVGMIDEGQHRQADQRQLPILAQDHRRTGRAPMNNLPQEIRQDVRSGQLDLVDVVHDRRHQLAGGVRFEKLRALLQDFVEDRVAQVGDGGETGVVDQVVAEVIAEPLDQEDRQDGEGDHGPDVVPRGREESAPGRACGGRSDR